MRVVCLVVAINYLNGWRACDTRVMGQQGTLEAKNIEKVVASAT